MQAAVIGIDLAKSVFQLCAVDKRGRELWSRKVSRGKLFSVLEQSPGAIVAMESCGGANHIGRQAQLKGFEVRLIAPKFAVKLSLRNWPTLVRHTRVGQFLKVSLRVAKMLEL